MLKITSALPVLAVAAAGLVGMAAADTNTTDAYVDIPICRKGGGGTFFPAIADEHSWDDVSVLMVTINAHLN